VWLGHRRPRARETEHRDVVWQTRNSYSEFESMSLRYSALIFSRAVHSGEGTGQVTVFMTEARVEGPWEAGEELFTCVWRIANSDRRSARRRDLRVGREALEFPSQ